MALSFKQRCPAIVKKKPSLFCLFNGLGFSNKIMTILRIFVFEIVFSSKDLIRMSTGLILSTHLQESLQHYLITLHSGECGELVQWNQNDNSGQMQPNAHMCRTDVAHSLEVQLTRFQNSACRVLSVLGGSVRLDRRKTVWWSPKIYMLFFILAVTGFVLKQKQSVWWSGKRK